MGFFDKYKVESVPRVRDYRREYAMRKAKALVKKQNEEYAHIVSQYGNAYPQVEN